MTVRRYAVTTLRAFSAAALLGILAATSASCAAPAASFSSLSDDDMKKLFPTESEIMSALGKTEALDGPKAAQFNITPSPAPSNGLTQGCYEAAYGNSESRAIGSTRGFTMTATGENGMRFYWGLAQRSSSGDVQKALDALKNRYSKCDRYEPLDTGTKSAFAFRIRSDQAANRDKEGAQVVVPSGDVSLSFNASCVSYEQCEQMAKKMAPVMEKRLQASAPKS